MRPVNETRMLARWKLGRVLAEAERAPTGRPEKSGKQLTIFWKWATQELGLTKPTIIAAQRIGTLPEKELKSAFAEWKERGHLLQPVLKRIRCRPRRYAAHLSDAP